MASEQINKRIQNQYHILSALHFDGASQRTQLSKKFGIRKTSVTNIVADLLHREIVIAEDPESIRSPIVLDNTKFHAIVAHITANQIHFGRLYLDGTTRAHSTASIGQCTTPQQVIDTLLEGITALRSNNNNTNSEGQLGIGVSLPGFVDPERGVSLHAVNLPNWDEIELKATLEAALDCPVLIENDVRAQLWCCTWFDHISSRTDNIIYLNIDEGIACSIMMHGQMIIGENASAGEIGQIHIAGDNGTTSQKLEDYASLPALIQQINRAYPDLDIKTADEIPSAVEQQVGVAALLKQTAERLAHVLAGIIAAIDPSAIVLGTPSRAFSEAFAKILQQQLTLELKNLHAGETELLVAEETVTSALKGVGGLVIDQAFKTGVFSV